MKILAIDHGDKRMGIAASDPLGMMAHPLEFIPSEPFDEFLIRLKEILAERETEQIIVGMPRNMDGSIGPQALKVEDFVAVLKKSVTVPVRTWDERLTTVVAEDKLREAGVNMRDAKKKVDASAAAVMLQDYMDSFS
ncbi:MAG: Holliday junction resolvase RuvX [Verrucomicrobiota bacterium]|jgi:putative Holliday junction resolvase|nr:Holliday junction resolvase RuvX [Verrucomicrobiota bacterium]